MNTLDRLTIEDIKTGVVYFECIFDSSSDNLKEVNALIEKVKKLNGEYTLVIEHYKRI